MTSAEDTRSRPDWDSMNFGLYVLGAGFSKPAGLPLANELWTEVLARAQRMEGRAARFMNDLDYYLEYLRVIGREDVSEENINFEEFLAFLDVEFHLGLRGPDTWSRDGNESQVVVKALIAEILKERTPERPPQLYLDFASLLKPNDFVLTLNYDCLLEQALDALGKPYRLFPDRYREVRPSGSAVVDSDDCEVVVLKLHGSMDWFDRRSYESAVETWRQQGVPGFPTHPIFNPDRGIELRPLVDGPRHEHDSLKTIYRVRDLNSLSFTGCMFFAAPLIVPPSTSKILWFDKLKGFWWGMDRGGALSFRMAIIGLSLAPHDNYLHQVLYTLVNNYQGYEWGVEYSGKIKSPLAIVDYRPTPESRAEFLERYRFVDWDRASLYLDGFDETVVAALS